MANTMDKREEAQGDAGAVDAKTWLLDVMGTWDFTMPTGAFDELVNRIAASVTPRTEQAEGRGLLIAEGEIYDAREVEPEIRHEFKPYAPPAGDGASEESDRIRAAQYEALRRVSRELKGDGARVTEAMVDAALTAYIASRGTYEGEVAPQASDMRAALQAALAARDAQGNGHE